MPTVLDQPVLRERAWPITVETYHKMIGHGLEGQRVELIRGVIVEKMPKSPLHEYFVDLLHERLKAALRDFWVRKEAPLTLGDSEPEPDVSVVEGARSDYRRGHPQTAKLVVEVAVSSAEIDRVKGAIYEQAGVEEYWIVFAEERVIEVRSNLRGAAWSLMRRYSAGETIASTALPGLSVGLDELFR